MMKDAVRTFTYSGSPERLDKIVCGELADELKISRSQIAQWVERGCVTVDGNAELRPGARIQSGAVVRVVVPAPEPTHLVPYERELEILFEDEHLIVVNKPSGLSMHPGAGNRSQTLANAIVAHVGAQQLKVGEVDRPGIVHRLDKDTTGVVVVAKTTAVLAGLAKQFNDRSIGREYLALVFTTPKARRLIQLNDSGEISAPIGRHPTERTKMAVVEGGRGAATVWRVVERFLYGTLVANTLKTGRTHQIRVHMDYMGSPVIGDQQYGNFSNLPKQLKEAAGKFGRQALHAARLSFVHPVTEARHDFSAPLSADMEQLIREFRDFQG